MKEMIALTILKALEILARIVKTPQDLYRYSDRELYKAIAELEALQSRSCDGCKHGKYGADSRGIEVECTLIWHCSRGNGFPDRYEAKDEQ